MAKNNIQRVCSLGSGTLKFTGTTNTFEYGAFSSVASGSGVTLSSSRTGVAKLYADDGGAVLAGSLRNLLARTLVTIDQTSGVSLRSLQGHIKLASGIDFSDVGSRVFGVEGLIEQAGNSSYSGQTGAIRAYIDAGSGNITAASGAYLGGVIAELRCTGTLTATGTVAAFIGKATENEASYKKWSYGLAFTNCLETALLKVEDDQTICSDSNESILADISATANAGFLKVVVGTSDRYIALYALKAS